MEKARQTAVDEATALREQVRRLDQSLARAEAKIARLEVASAAAQGADASAGDELDMPNKRPRVAPAPSTTLSASLTTSLRFSGHRISNQQGRPSSHHLLLIIRFFEGGRQGEE